MKTIALSLVLALFTAHVLANNFYLSNTGNDSDSGLNRNMPWLTFTNLNKPNLLQPGDSIFLKRGSVFKGQLTISVANVYVGAYGLGAKPVISGSMGLTNWIQFKENIWRADCIGSVSKANNLFLEGKRQTLGRYPNLGYICSGDYNLLDNSIKDNSQHFVDGHWKNAVLVVRSSRWTIDQLLVTNYIDQQFCLEEKPSYALREGFGYFLQNHISTLDRQGEWFSDSSSRQIYIYLNESEFPSLKLIEISIFDFGIIARQANGIVIENISFDKQRLAGIRIDHCNNALLNKNEITNSGKNGVEVLSSSDTELKYSMIQDSNNNGVEWTNSPGAIIRHNKIERTGLDPGQGGSGNGTYIALYLTSSSISINRNIIEYNIIDSTGYSGIDFRTGHTHITNNTINQFCLVKDDGAGVYTWGNSKADNRIESNIISNGIGNGDGTSDKMAQYASGIYIDDQSRDILVANNSVSACSLSGIFVHNATHLQLYNNTLSSNGNCLANVEVGQLLIKLDHSISPDSNLSLQIECFQNKLISTIENVPCLFISNNKDEKLFRIGIFKQNNFIACHSDQAIALLNSQNNFCISPEKYTLEEFHTLASIDEGSVFKTLESDGNFKWMSKELISGSEDHSAMKGWAIWPDKNVLENERIEWTNGYSLNARKASEVNEVLLYHTGVYFDNSKTYRLHFAAKSTKPDKIEFVPMMASEPWAAMSKSSCFAIDESYKEFIYYFKCENTTNIEARVNFKSHSSFWIKDITLFEVVDPSATNK